MTKDEFAAKLAGKSDLSKAKARDVIDCIFATDPGHGIVAEGIQFPWRWNGGTISLNSGVIWNISV